MNQIFCIAADTFSDTTVAPLRYAAKDARAIGALMADRYGYSVRFALQPSASDVFAAFERCLSALQPGDKLITYFAGHALLKEQDQLLLACDARLGLAGLPDIATVPGMISLHALSRLVPPSVAQHLVILDCCRAPQLANDGISRGLVLGDSESGEPRQFGTFRLRREGQSPTVLSAADLRGSKAIELVNREHGLFTWSLMKLLDVPAAQAGLLQIDDAFLVRLTALARHELAEATLGVSPDEVRPTLHGPAFRLL